MASAIFAVLFTTHIGPDFSALGEGWLYYTAANGERAGGFSCIGHVPYPLPPTTCLVRVWSSPERIAEMAAMADYLFIEDVDEPVLEVNPMADLDVAAAERMEANPKFRAAVEGARRAADEILRPAAEAEGIQLESNAEVDARLDRARRRSRKVQVSLVTPSGKPEKPEKPPDKPPKPERPNKVKVKGWLKAKGHKDVDNIIDSYDDVTDGILALHGVTLGQYQVGKSG